MNVYFLSRVGKFFYRPSFGIALNDAISQKYLEIPCGLPQSIRTFITLSVCISPRIQTVYTYTSEKRNKCMHLINMHTQDIALGGTEWRC